MRKRHPGNAKIKLFYRECGPKRQPAHQPGAEGDVAGVDADECPYKRVRSPAVKMCC